VTDKHQVKRGIHELQRVKTWQLVILFVLVAFIAATLLRLNNVGMVQRRNAVIAADKNGVIDDIHARLYDLQRYSAAHMNAETGVFYLQEQYNRDTTKALQAAQDANPNSTANAEAERVCKPQFSGYSTAYLQCFIRELEKYPTSETLPDVKTPNPALYRYSFSSPLWSPDAAGLSIVVGMVILLVIILRLIALSVLHLLLKRSFRDA